MGDISDSVSNIADFKKAVISLWFIVPQESIDAAKASYDPNAYPVNLGPNGVPGTPMPQLNGIVPLFTFGKTFSAGITAGGTPMTDSYTQRAYYLYHYTDPPACDLRHEDLTMNIDAAFGFPSVVGYYDTDQSFIGVDCTGDTPFIRVKLQTGDTPTASAMYAYQTGVSAGLCEVANYICDTADCPGYGISSVPVDTVKFPSYSGYGSVPIPSSVWETSSTYSDFTSYVLNEPASFNIPIFDAVIVPGKWHHLLISFDIDGSMSATGSYDGGDRSLSTSCHMWASLNDINCTRIGDADYSAGLATNQIASEGAIFAYEASPDYRSERDANNGMITLLPGANDWGMRSHTINNPGTPAYSWTPSGVPINGSYVGFPASSLMTSKIRHCEMAEAQVFTDVAVDTGDVTMRRLFVGADGKPAKTSLPIAYFGKSPEISLTKSSKNWQRGKNLGTTDQFNPTGNIKVYRPNPRIGA